MKKVCVIGHFGEGKDLVNGQTIKTKILTAELKKQFGEGPIETIDTSKGVRGIFKLIISLANSFRTCENVIILPAQNGIKIIAPLCVLYRKLWHRKVHYVVIGGWLPNLLTRNKVLTGIINKIDCVYVETAISQKRLNELGLKNIVIMQNFKPLSILSKDEIMNSVQYPLRVCTFSRVTEKKGIFEAVKAIEDINKKYGSTIYTLDIYGQVEEGQEKWFSEIEQDFSADICYKGAVDYSDTTDVLKAYYLLLFPTKYFTEGIPGTVIDSYAAGLPVVASRWESFSDVVDDGKTGFGYEFGNYEIFVNLLDELSKNPMKVTKMKYNCLDKAADYMPAKAIIALLGNM